MAGEGVAGLALKTGADAGGLFAWAPNPKDWGAALLAPKVKDEVGGAAGVGAGALTAGVEPNPKGADDGCCCCCCCPKPKAPPAPGAEGGAPGAAALFEAPKVKPPGPGAGAAGVGAAAGAAAFDPNPLPKPFPKAGVVEFAAALGVDPNTNPPVGAAGLVSVDPVGAEPNTGAEELVVDEAPNMDPPVVLVAPKLGAPDPAAEGVDPNIDVGAPVEAAPKAGGAAVLVAPVDPNANGDGAAAVAGVEEGAAEGAAEDPKPKVEADDGAAGLAAPNKGAVVAAGAVDDVEDEAPNVYGEAAGFDSVVVIDSGVAVVAGVDADAPNPNDEAEGAAAVVVVVVVVVAGAPKLRGGFEAPAAG